MNTHRAGKFPDWDKVPIEQRNIWQRMASESHGKITPGNALTVAGAKIFASGLSNIRKGDKLRGIIGVGVGRAFDIFDGYTAEVTGTKSPTGETLDATVDTAEAFIGLPVLVANDMLPLRTGLIYGTHKIANTVSTSVARLLNREIHPSRAGKIAGVAGWSSIVLYGLANVAADNESNSVASVLQRGANIAEAASIVAGTAASIGYAMDAFANPDITN